jgi:hypothetical protein
MEVSHGIFERVMHAPPDVFWPSALIIGLGVAGAVLLVRQPRRRQVWGLLIPVPVFLGILATGLRLFREVDGFQDESVDNVVHLSYQMPTNLLPLLAGALVSLTLYILLWGLLVAEGSATRKD